MIVQMVGYVAVMPKTIALEKLDVMNVLTRIVLVVRKSFVAKSKGIVESIVFDLWH